MSKLTQKQAAFVREYLADLNATAAGLRAGYSHGMIGRRLMTVPKVAAAIEKEMAERLKRIDITADYVLNRLVEIDQMDCLDILSDDGGIKPVSAWPKIWRQFISGFDVADIFGGQGDERKLVGLLKKIKWPDKVKNLELIGRHINVQAFSDKAKVEHTGKDGGPIMQSNVTQEQLDEAVRNVRDKF